MSQNNFQTEDALVYRENQEGANADEIRVAMWNGSRNTYALAAGADRVRTCLEACSNVACDVLEERSVQALLKENERLKQELAQAMAAAPAQGQEAAAGVTASQMDAIEGAMCFGAKGINPPPAGHWLERAWIFGRDAFPQNRVQEADLRRQRDKLLSACKTAHATLERDGDEWGICAMLEAAMAASKEGGAV